MKMAKIMTSILLASTLLLAQVLVVFAAPKQASGPIVGTVQAVTLEKDPNTGITTVLVESKDKNGQTQTVRISLETAESPDLGLVTLDDNGNPVIVNPLPEYIQINPATVLSEEEQQNPVASALATFFSNIPDLNYDAIMEAHMNGNGFGVIAQALFLTEKLGGNAEIFQKILQAKKDNNYSNFPLDDGTIPTSWGQLRKAIADKHLGIAMSHNNGNNNDKSNANNGNGDSSNNANNENSNKDKNKDKSNNGNGNGNGNGSGNGNGNGNKP